MPEVTQLGGGQSRDLNLSGLALWHCTAQPLCSLQSGKESLTCPRADYCVCSTLPVSTACYLSPQHASCLHSMLPVSTAPCCPGTHVNSPMGPARGSYWRCTYFPDEDRKIEEAKPYMAAPFRGSLAWPRLYTPAVSSEPRKVGTALSVRLRWFGLTHTWVRRRLGWTGHLGQVTGPA